MIAAAMVPILKLYNECHASCDDLDYWNARLIESALSRLQIAKLLDAVNAPPKVRAESLPEDDERTRCLGMGLSELLLQRYLGQGWEVAFYDKEGIYLIAPERPENLTDTGQHLLLGRQRIPMSQLKSRQELLDYLAENDATHSALMDFCDPYREQYHNELCWSYPISDGKHLGTFLVLVREGVLSLPYDDAYKVDYELFCLEDACMCDAEALKIFLSDWERFSGDLEHSMLCMLEYLKSQEEVQDE